MAQEASINDFGLLIAYVLPGFTALWAATYVSHAFDPWVGSASADAPTVGGFLYMTVASVAAGMAVSTVRWMVIDTLHHRTGIAPPQWDFALLRGSVDAFSLIVDHTYRYYQAGANMVVSLALVLGASALVGGILTSPLRPGDLGLVVLMVVFFLGSRDSLRRYYKRGGQLLREPRADGDRGGESGGKGPATPVA